MGDQTRIKSLVKEAEFYRSQGLLDESKEKCLEALELIRKLPKFSGQQMAIEAVENKISSLEADLARLDEETEAPQLSEDVLELIKRTFAFSKDQDAAAIEGAIALAKFGQYDSALAEFNKILNNGTTPVAAAKNIIRCHLVLSSADAAIDQFQQWLSGDLLSTQQLKKIRSFFEQLLSSKGIQTELPEVVDESSGAEVAVEPAEAPAGEEKEEDLLDISSVGVTLEAGPRKGSLVELDVTFQSGNVISLILSQDDTDLIDALVVGTPLKDVQLYSPIAIFSGSGNISGKTRIESGPKAGNYIVNLTIDSTST